MRHFSIRALQPLFTAMAAMLAAAAVAVAQTPPAATARFQPSRIVAGEVGSYRIELEGSASVTPASPPQVTGLVVQYQGQGSDINFVFANGQLTRSVKTVLQYAVQAPQPGNYTIPAFDMQAGANPVRIPAATLEVVAAPPIPAGASGGAAYSLTATTPRTDIYVGEKVPLEITLACRADMQPNVSQGDLARFEQFSDAFEQVRLSGRFDQGGFTRDNVRLVSGTWQVVTTPLKSGPQTLQFSMPFTVQVEDNPFGGAFGPRISGFFTTTRPMVAHSAPLELNVLPLPSEGRPQNFTGGIGLFSAEEPKLSTTDLQAGVPVTVTLNVSGTGNFDRFQVPALDAGPLWRAYKPKETFTPSDDSGMRGVKSFEFILIPMSDKITEMPAPSVNFFNPETKSYVELPLTPVPVTVRPAPPGQAPTLPVAGASGPPAPQTALVGIVREPGDLRPRGAAWLFENPWFILAQAAPAIVLGALIITRRRQLRLETDPAYARRLRARRESRAAVERARAAAAAGRAAEFYAHAQRALQDAASHSAAWPDRQAAAALTWEEFDSHLATAGASAETRAQSREIFDAGDALRFGGFSPDQAALSEAAARLQNLVQQLLQSA